MIASLHEIEEVHVVVEIVCDDVLGARIDLPLKDFEILRLAEGIDVPFRIAGHADAEIVAIENERH